MIIKIITQYSSDAYNISIIELPTSKPLLKLLNCTAAPLFSTYKKTPDKETIIVEKSAEMIVIVIDFDFIFIPIDQGKWRAVCASKPSKLDPLVR